MENWNEVKVWRKGRRAELIAARLAVVPAQRMTWGERITVLLETGFALPSGAVIDFCRPYKGEFSGNQQQTGQGG